jgi:hypothetical protein
MKKLSFEKGFVKVTLSVALLLSQSGVAESYESYANSFTGDLSQAESALSRVGGSATTGSPADQVRAVIERNEKLLSQNKEEFEQRTKLKDWVQKNDALKSLKGMPDVLLQKALKKRQVDLNKAEQLAAQLDQAPTSSSTLNTSNLPKACQKNVDFSQVRGFLDQLSTEPGQYLKRTAQRLLKEKREDLKQKQVQKLAEVMKYFKDLSQKDESVEALASDSIKGDIGVEKRIAELKSKNKSQKDLNKELKGDLVDVFSKFMGQLGEIRENDKRVSQLAGEFTKMLQNIRRQASEAAQEQTDQLRANCETELRKLNNDIQMSTGWMVKWGVSQEVAQLDTQAQLQRAAGLQCEDVSDRVQAVLQGASGTNINGRISSINAAKEPSTLMSEAVAAMQDVANMQAAISEELKPLSESCEDIVNSREAVKQRIQPIVAQTNNGTVTRNGTSSVRSGSALGQSSIGSQPFSNSSSTHSGNTGAFRK